MPCFFLPVPLQGTQRVFIDDIPLPLQAMQCIRLSNFFGTQPEAMSVGTHPLPNSWGEGVLGVLLFGKAGGKRRVDGSSLGALLAGGNLLGVLMGSKS